MSDFKKYLNVYQFEITLPGTGELIQFKPITTGQIKKLLVYEDSENLNIIGKAVDEGINTYVKTIVAGSNSNTIKYENGNMVMILGVICDYSNFHNYKFTTDILIKTE